MNASDIQSLVAHFLTEKKNGADCEFLNSLADEIQKCNLSSYSDQTAFVSRRYKVSHSEMEKWKRLEKYIKPNKSVKLFDCAFGSGRDLLIAQNLGYDVYGCELSEFLFFDFLSSTHFDRTKVVNSDFRTIPYPDMTFDIVRHNASFLHLPVINKGYTVHKCLEESFRILKNDGYLYIYTKEGTGFITLDTGDGLGVRSFQLFDEKSLTKLLLECGFGAKHINHFIKARNGIEIKWIEIFAQKRV